MKKTHLQFNRILIANRGEIAVRIIKTAKEMGIETVAIYTEAESNALHVEKADLKALMKGDGIEDTYLNAAQILHLAERYGVDAIHPGYGFLSENDAFAQLCEEKGIVFIGPSPQQIKMMGNKDEANKIAARCNIPLLKKVNGTLEQMLQQSKSLSLPLVIKAAAGGGGKGMRVVHSYHDLETEINRAGAEAARYFGNPSVYIEEYIENPRHIEVQILADQYGNTIHLHERECSIQRRHQKVIEEAPAPNLRADVKNKIIADALVLAQYIGYTNAGTVEFLLTTNQQHYFLEMNTRIQVEHPITEEITGVDIVKEQINIALGKILSYSQSDISICGHAIEARIYAENPKDNFAPSFGKIMGTHIPTHPYIRIDGGAQPNENLNPNFDPLLKKVIAKGSNRAEAISRLNLFLMNYALFGVESNREMIMHTLRDTDFLDGNYSTSFFDKKQAYLFVNQPILTPELEVISAAYVILKNYIKNSGNDIWNKMGYWRLLHQHCIRFDGCKAKIDVKRILSKRVAIQVDEGSVVDVSEIRIEQNELSFIISEVNYLVHYLVGDDGLFYLQYKGVKRVVSDRPERIKRSHQTEETEFIKQLNAPMPGRIIDVMVKEGEQIKKGMPLMVLEAMKTENVLHAWKNITVTKVSVAKGQQVTLNQLLIETE